MDPHSEARLAQVIPELADKIRTMYADLLPFEIEIRVVQGYRTFADQQKLYEQGRTRPGPIVTNTPGGYSAHNFGIAVDCMPEKVWGVPWEPDPDASDVHYAKMVAAGRALGLNCGADWHSFKDFPHFQVPNAPTNPNAQMRADLESGGLALVWSNVSAGKYGTWEAT